METLDVGSTLFIWPTGSTGIDKGTLQPEFSTEPGLDVDIENMNVDYMKESTSLLPMNKSRDRSRKRAYCLECGNSILKRTLQRHWRTVHKHGRMFNCQNCGQAFPRKDALDRHHREQHEHDGPVECMNCGKVVRERSFKSHLESRKCREHRPSRNGGQLKHKVAQDLREPMLAARPLRSSKGYQLGQTIGLDSMDDPLLASVHLAHEMTRACRMLQEEPRLLFESTLPKEEELLLNNAAIRAIHWRLSTGIIDDALEGAIRTLAFVHCSFYPETAGPHEAVVKWIRKARCDRQSAVAFITDSALEYSRASSNKKSARAFSLFLEPVRPQYPERGLGWAVVEDFGIATTYREDIHGETDRQSTVPSSVHRTVSVRDGLICSWYGCRYVTERKRSRI